MQSISLNTHYLVLGKQPTDASQIHILGRQMFLFESKLFMQAYKLATTRAYVYVFLNFRSTTPDLLRIRPCVLKKCSPSYQRAFSFAENKMEIFVLVPLADHIKLIPKDAKSKKVKKKGLQKGSKKK